MTQEQQLLFEAFYRTHFKSLVVYAYRFLKNWDDAKEIAQEAFLTGLLRIDQFYGSENQIGWIKSTIWKKAQNLNKVKRNRSTITIPLEDPSFYLPTYDHYAEVDAPFAHSAELLSEQEFLLIRRVYMEGEPYRNIAEEFGMTEGACRKRVERIIKKLREKWDESS